MKKNIKGSSQYESSIVGAKRARFSSVADKGLLFYDLQINYIFRCCSYELNKKFSLFVAETYKDIKEHKQVFKLKCDSRAQDVIACEENVISRKALLDKEKEKKVFLDEADSQRHNDLLEKLTGFF